MRKGLIVIFICLVIFSCLVRAEISLNQPNDIYNLGDKLFVTVTNIKGSETGNLNIDLICQNQTINLLKISARAFSLEGGQSYSIPYKILSKSDLEIENIKFIVGRCRIKAALASDVYETKPFVISDLLSIDGSIDKIRYNPGEEIILKVNVKRADGGTFSGFYKINNFTNEEGEIQKGEIEKTIKIDENKAPGNYFITLEAYNLDSEEELNKGSIELLVVINQVATGIEPALSSNEIEPGNEFKLNPRIIDQAGGTIEGTISIHLSDPEGNKIDYSVKSGETLTINFPENATKGLWTIYFVSGELVKESEISVLILEKVDYVIENGILKVRNVGNTDYYGLVEIKIGETSQEMEMKLKVGEVKEFILEAPEGEYDISVNDGKNSYSQKSFLTGNAVNVREVGSGKVFGGFSFMWIFLIFLFICIGIVILGVYYKTNIFSKMGLKKTFQNLGFRKLKKSEEEKSEKGIIDLTKKEAGSAESSLVLDGEKIESTIVCVRIKDRETFNETIQREVSKIIKESAGEKGVLDIKNDFIYMIYSPLNTKSYKNELLAIQIAQGLLKKLSYYQKKLSGEFKFGIGINTGFLVSKKEGTKLKYTSIGNTISLANKISELSKENILMSDKTRKRVISDIKATKVVSITNMDVYLLNEIKNKEANEAKLKDLLKRMGKNPDSDRMHTNRTNSSSHINNNSKSGNENRALNHHSNNSNAGHQSSSSTSHHSNTTNHHGSSNHHTNTTNHHNKK